MRRARRAASNLGDLLKRQTAPKVGDDNLALVEGQGPQGSGGGVGVKATQVTVFQPRGSAASGDGLVMPPAPLCSGGREGAVADYPIQPGHGTWRRLAPGGQLHESFLDHVFGRKAPLARVQHQRRGVLVEQSSQEVRAHHLDNAGRGVSSQECRATLS
jgi:hypothetical protein